MRRFSVVAVVLSAAGCASAQAVFTETFANNTNTGGWTFGAPVEFIAPSGGNPGAYLRAEGIDTTIPFLRTGEGVASAFTGDYRARGVIQVRASLNVFHTDFPIGSRPPAIILYSENGTPGNSSDDWGAYALNTLPLATQGQWGVFTWAIPAQQSTLPAGWSYIEFGPSVPPSRSWDTLVRGVDRLMISFGDPSLFYIFQMWDVGADTIEITELIEPPSCYPNCDGSTGGGFLNVNDFVCFQSRFAGGEPYADCNHDNARNVLDFVCFQSAFAAGCSAP